jgi:hypothetical protein
MQDIIGYCEILATHSGDAKCLRHVWCDAVSMGGKFRTFKIEQFAFIFNGHFVSEDPEDEGTIILLQCINH